STERLIYTYVNFISRSHPGGSFLDGCTRITVQRRHGARTRASHSCVPGRDFSRPVRRHEWRRGTQECVRHVRPQKCEVIPARTLSRLDLKQGTLVVCIAL